MKRLMAAFLMLLMLMAGQSHAQTCNSAIPASTPTSRFVINGDWTVTDGNTGLTWKRCSEGQTWNGSTCTGTPSTYTWQQALQQAQTLNAGAGYAGQNDWRVPNTKELHSILEHQCSSPVINEMVFPGAPTSFFWSASPLAYDYEPESESGAWGVDFNTGYDGAYYVSNSLNVRLVRDGQPPIDTPPPNFVFSQISSPQTEAQSFPVTISTVDNQGALLGFSGEVSLSSNVGAVSPSPITIENGAWSGPVKIYGSASDVQLHAAGSGGFGDSNSFEVFSLVPKQIRLSGKVVYFDGQPVDSATVFLGNDGDDIPDFEASTNADGYYEFLDLPPGSSYELWVEYDDPTRSTPKKELPPILNTQNREINLGTFSYSGKTPVILVPGILESTLRGTKDNYPSLPFEYSNDATLAPRLVIHDPDIKLYDINGASIHRPRVWEELRSYLKFQEGYAPGDIFDAPYDWRMPVEEVAQTFLREMIKKAKEDTGSPQVDIVAHSTGGLVARAYIQDTDYTGDVRKLAMVGTPNDGSSLMYYLWGGGDPKLGDDSKERGLIDGLVRWDCQCDWWLNFYFNSLNNLYAVYNDGDELDPDDNRIFWKFLHSNTYGPKPLGGEGRQLLPIHPIIRYSSFWGGTSISKLTSPGIDGNTNEWLQNLNANVDNMSKDGSFGTVETKVFYSKSEPTVDLINIKTNDKDKIAKYGGLWRDGKPKGAPEFSDGDGTVLESSATSPNTAGWAGIQDVGESSHADLIAVGKEEIGEFLNPPAEQAAQSNAATSMPATSIATQTSTVTSVLSVTLFGRERPHLETPAGLASGVDPVSSAIIEDIPSTELALEARTASIRIENPDDGIFTVSLSGNAQEQMRIGLSYAGDIGIKDEYFWLYHHGGVSSFTFRLDSVASDPLTITHIPEPPTELVASVIDENGTDSTRLTWQLSPTQGVSTYHVYGRRYDEPYFTQIGTVQNNVFDTGDLWPNAQGEPERIYMVSAVLPDGTESLLSNSAKNNDWDHDGLIDTDEALLGTDPELADTDNDGITDKEELNLGTDPLLFDTDSDGFSDGAEVAVGTDPLESASFPGIADGDLNGDGLVNTADVIISTRILMGQIVPTQDQVYHGDVAPLVNGIPISDGAFNIGDVLVIQRKALGIVNF